MSKSKMSPEELEAESLRFHALREKRKEEGLKAVAEMSKHPLSLEQMRAQIREHQAEANKDRKMHLHIDVIETDENGKRKEYGEGTHKQIVLFGYRNFGDKRIVAKSEVFKDIGSLSYGNNKWVFNEHKLSRVN